MLYVVKIVNRRESDCNDRDVYDIILFFPLVVIAIISLINIMTINTC